MLPLLLPADDAGTLDVFYMVSYACRVALIVQLYFIMYKRTRSSPVRAMSERCQSDMFAIKIAVITLPAARARAPMALSKLSGDAQGIIFGQLCNVLDPGVAVALSSVSNELRTATQPLLPQLASTHRRWA